MIRAEITESKGSFVKEFLSRSVKKFTKKKETSPGSWSECS